MSEIKAYCVHCKKNVMMTVPNEIIMKNRVQAWRDSCPRSGCGKSIFKIGLRC